MTKRRKKGVSEKFINMVKEHAYTIISSSENHIHVRSENVPDWVKNLDKFQSDLGRYFKNEITEEELKKMHNVKLTHPLSDDTEKFQKEFMEKWEAHKSTSDQ